jgi:putative thioredoxin
MEQPNNIENIVDITPDNFQQVIVEESKVRLIVIGFWTARDPSCVELMENLATLLVNYPESVVFARIDVDTQQQIAMQFGIQSVPTVALFRDAKPVENFVGMKTVPELEAFLLPHLPKEEDLLLTQCQAAIVADDYASAYGLAQKAYELSPERLDIKLAVIDVSINAGKLDDAQTLIESIKMIDQDAYYQSLQSALQLAQSAADSPEIQALQQQLEQQPDDHELKVKLAVQLSQTKRNEEALELLFGVLRRDMAFGDAKKNFLDILATLPDGDALAGKYRRKMYSLLY